MGGVGSLSNTMWPEPRPTSTPSFILIYPAIWPQYTNVTGRTGEDRQDNGPIAYGKPFHKQSPNKRTHTQITTTPHHNRFMALFPGPPGSAGARIELLDFMVQGKTNRGRETDHLAGRHSIWTNQCPPPPSSIFLQAGCPSCHPTNSVKALKATSAFGLGRRR